MPFGGFNLGTHVGDELASVRRNRSHLGQVLGLSAVQWLQQVHGVQVHCASRATSGAAVEADAQWTTEAGLGLAIMTADCLPIVLFSADGRWVAAIHAGWRGLVAGVIATTVAALKAAVGNRCSEWRAWIGPAIGPAHYQVGEEVAVAVRALHGSESIATRGLSAAADIGKYQLDLAALGRWLLAREGVSAVCHSGLCTYADTRFYSHRRSSHQGQQTTGRQATLIWLRQ